MEVEGTCVGANGRGKHFFGVSADDLAPVLSNGISSIAGCPQGGELTVTRSQ